MFSSAENADGAAADCRRMAYLAAFDDTVSPDNGIAVTVEMQNPVQNPPAS